MGKKAKKKTNRSAQKEKQSPISITQKSPSTIVDEGSVVKESRICPHIDTGINLDKVSSKIASLESPVCDDCREGVVDRRSSKSKGKHSKKKGGVISTTSQSKSIWVCLECGQFTCGGIGFPTTPHTHATRHSKQNHHPLAIQFANPNLCFCFHCNTLIPVQTSEENGEQKDAFSSVVKVLKTPPSPAKTSVDVEDVWFGNGSVTSEVKSVNTQIVSENNGGFYMVKGLTNLGNTCFFNSILQNLLAMDTLRDHFLNLETPVGPLSVSLQKLFVKTNPSTFDKNVINPQPLFNSICTMAPQFKGFQQQDSHELLRFLLDGLCNEGKNVQKEQPCFVDAIFGGQICSSVSCLECGHTSIVYEPYLDLSLPLPAKKSSSKKLPLVSKSKKQKPPPKRRDKIGTKVHRASDPSPPASEQAALGDIIEKISGITITESGIPSDDCNGNPAADISSWLDYLEPTKVSSDSWLDYLDPCSPSNNHDLVSPNGNLSVVEDTGNGNELFWEEEPRRVQESEILLLPYTELTSTSNGNGNGNGNEMAEETSDFDGFGGLFDEPEVVSAATVKNSSDSDSDEVDNSEFQVSVDKCLAYFTTSEILTKTDHAWQCEQCSKALLEQKLRLKKKLQEPPVSNGAGIGIPSIPSDSGIEPSFSNGNGNGIPNVPSGSGIEESVSNGVGNGNGNGNGNGKGNGIESDCSQMLLELEERASVENGGNSSESSHHQSSVADSNGHDDSNSNSNSNGVKDEVDSGSVRVIRDASKRILISTAPPILTIHLKRLSQDARGRLSKLSGHVDFKDTIDLEPYMDPRSRSGGRYRYGLIGVVEHSGTARGGHYVAYVRGGLQHDDCLWFHASDAHVRQVSLEEVFLSEAYILFYHKI